jgi:TfoX/Sxy family transcriptional regulator of competence genes
MATSKEFIDYICEQITEAGNIESKKMFGDYMIYCTAKPVLLVCDNTIFVKQFPEVTELFSNYERILEVGTPYKGAKPHYIVDV